MGWTVRGSKVGGGGALAHPGAHPAPQHSGYRVFFLEVKRPGPGVDNPPHLAPRLKKEQSYNSVHLLGLHGLFWGAETSTCLLV